MCTRHGRDQFLMTREFLEIIAPFVYVIMYILYRFKTLTLTCLKCVSGCQDADFGGCSLPVVLGTKVGKYLQRLCFTLFPRFIMETTLKMQIVQFNNAVYWVRVVIFLLPFLHSISEI